MIIAIANTTSNNNVKASSVDPDAAAFFSRVTTAGGTLTATEQTAVDTLVKSMKSTGVWASMKAVYPMVGSSAAACAQNLKSASFTGTFSSGWTFSSTGVTPNGLSAFMNTNLNSATSLSLNSVHLSYYSRTNINNGSVEMGISRSSSLYLLYSYANSNFKALNRPQSLGGSLFIPTTGLLIGSRPNNVTEKYYHKGVLIDTLSISSLSIPTENIYLGCYNNGGVASEYSTKECAFSSIGDGLTDTQAVNFYTAVQAFQTTLGRQV